MSRPTQDTAIAKLTCLYGAITRYGRTFQFVPVHGLLILQSYNPGIAVTIPVWATSRSLAAT